MSTPQSLITIQCRLVATEETRRLLWLLMAEKNTPFTYELLKRVSQHADFETWQLATRSFVETEPENWLSELKLRRSRSRKY